MEYQQLQDEIKAAMKARDNHRRDILRQVHTELKAIEVNERREVPEADVDAMLKRTIKQTKETLDGSIKAGNNQERTDTLTKQVAILEEYLPRQVEGNELAALIEVVLADTGASTKKDMGRVMGELTRPGSRQQAELSRIPIQRKEGLPHGRPSCLDHLSALFPFSRKKCQLRTEMEPPVHASSSRRASSKLECEAAASKASFSLRESCLKAYSACMASCLVANSA